MSWGGCRFAALLLVLAVCAAPAAAEIFKCRDPRGGVVYSDAPCKGQRLTMDERGSVTIVQTTPVPRAAIKPEASPVIAAAPTQIPRATEPDVAAAQPRLPASAPQVIAAPISSEVISPQGNATADCNPGNGGCQPAKTPKPTKKTKAARSASSTAGSAANGSVTNSAGKDTSQPDPEVPKGLPVVKMKPPPDQAAAQ
ncbi:hypothetical protein IGB42_03436 [Andreprevotia sp. IGB-42]|uniref:DUF4124 domain-containing protein n=1 Tax=Andreprevotia sp. IGB-42 TaxID=2497473 RepID=UPI00135B0A78|nr:DUF4124 domain-containing protein [Andreprevotia sp. IGB-42]KAF0812158.1 hypothetical protein IGB42_03436 [Andreprevotia sp. IGB-42]